MCFFAVFLTIVSSNAVFAQSNKPSQEAIDLATGEYHTAARPRLEGVDADEIDFSDLCNQSRDYFWIISDEAKRLFLYDWKTNKVMQSAKLGYGHDGEYKEIEKAEGVTLTGRKSSLRGERRRSKALRL